MTTSATQPSRADGAWTSTAILRALAEESGDRRSLVSAITSKASVDQLSKALDEAPDAGISRLLAQMLGSRGARNAVPALIRALSHDDATVRYAAADAIGKVFLLKPSRRPRWRAEAGRALMSALEAATEPGERAMIISALGAVQFVSAAPVIAAEASRTTDVDTREAATWALERLRSAVPDREVSPHINGIAAIEAAEALRGLPPDALPLIFSGVPELPSGLVPSAAMQEAFEQLAKPTAAMQQALYQILGPSAAMQKAFEQFAKPAAAMQEAFEQLAKPTAAMQEAFEQLAKPTAAMQEAFEQLAKPSAALQQAFEQMMKPSLAMQESIGSVLASLTFARRDLSPAMVDAFDEVAVALRSLLDVDALADASLILASTPTGQVDSEVNVDADFLERSLEALHAAAQVDGDSSNESSSRLAVFVVMYLAALRSAAVERREAAVEVRDRLFAFLQALVTWGRLVEA